jgi:UDP-N-acetylglucosamine acyltransferase
MIGGGARISVDVAPYALATERNSIYGLNMVGLRRRRFDSTVLREIKEAFRWVYGSSANVRARAADALAHGTYSSAEARRFLEFFGGGERAFARLHRHAGEDAGAAT